MENGGFGPRFSFLGLCLAWWGELRLGGSRGAIQGNGPWHQTIDEIVEVGEDQLDAEAGEKRERGLVFAGRAVPGQDHTSRD